MVTIIHRDLPSSSYSPQHNKGLRATRWARQVQCPRPQTTQQMTMMVRLLRSVQVLHQRVNAQERERAVLVVRQESLKRKNAIIMCRLRSLQVHLKTNFSQQSSRLKPLTLCIQMLNVGTTRNLCPNLTQMASRSECFKT